jgi:hypothetical protein
MSYTVARQAMHGRVDPQLLTPSTFAADLGAVTLQSASGNRASEQTIDHVTVDGTLAGSSGGRVDVRARESASDWQVVVHDSAGNDATNRVGHLDGRISLVGLDRTQAKRLAAAARSFRERGKTGSGPSLPARQDSLREMLDATDGLLTRVEADETLDHLAFNLGPDKGGSLGRMQLRLTGSAEDQRLNAGMDITLDELSLATLSAESAAYVPHHVTAKSILTGIPSGLLKALLRKAIAPDANSVLLQKQAAALLAAPGASAAVESLVFDAGPLRVRSSARLVPRATGEVGADIHISAAGVDALVGQLQANPNTQGVLPMVFMAKGAGRAEGDSIVWDIALGGGPITINGVPFGQPAPQSRQSGPPGRTR